MYYLQFQDENVIFMLFCLCAPLCRMLYAGTDCIYRTELIAQFLLLSYNILLLSFGSYQYRSIILISVGNMLQGFIVIILFIDSTQLNLNRCCKDIIRKETQMPGPSINASFLTRICFYFAHFGNNFTNLKIEYLYHPMTHDTFLIMPLIGKFVGSYGF